MAFPVISSVTNSNQGTNNATRTVTFATASTGDLIIGVIFGDGTGTYTWPGGGATWQEIKDAAIGSVAGISVAYLIAAGGESSVAVTCSASERSTHFGIRILAANWHGSTPPEISAGATGASTAPDPDTLTPSWGAADTLWIALYGVDSGNVTAYPTNYNDNQTASDTTASAAYGAMASRGANTASENPGAFTNSVSDDWAAYTIGVRPSGLLTRTWTESVSTADAWTRTGTFLRTLTQAISTGDAWVASVLGPVVAYLDEIGRYLTDKVSEAGERVFAKVSETGRWNNVPAAAGVVIRTWAETISSADAWTRTGTFTRTLTEAVTTSDAWVRVASFVRATTEAVSTADVWTRAITVTRSWAETISTADVWTRVLSAVRSWTSSATTSDAWTRTGTFLRSTTESLSTADAWTGVRLLVRTWTSSATTSDAWTRTGTFLRSTTEAITTSDVWTRTGTFVRSFTSALSMADTWLAEKLGGVVIRTWSEAIATADSWTRQGTFLRSWAEALSTADVWTRVKTAVRSWTSSATTSDVWTRSLTAVRSTTESLTTSDAWTRAATLARSWTEAITTSDAWVRLISAATSGLRGPIGLASNIVSRALGRSPKPSGSASNPKSDGTGST